ncbi:MAG: phosphatidate cytidylyltransferase [Christensenellales bacterium]|jgi:phosphatidate cytidylyltransferase|nr:phosphatidate cytidylyltransferase [Clostridiales bacterium]
MKKRIITGALLLIALVIVLVLGGWVFASVWFLCMCIALFEVMRALEKGGHRVVRWPQWITFIVSSIAVMLFREKNSAPIIITTFLFSILITCIYVLRHDDPKLENYLVSLLPLHLIVFPGLSMLGLLRIENRTLSSFLLTLVFVLPETGDMGAYFIGSRFGKKKLLPAVSPSKTIIGSIAGLVSSLVFSLLLFAVWNLQNTGVLWWHIVSLALLGGVFEQVGDLFASLIKRHCAIKDFGHIFPGHGGMMDRMDSILPICVLIYVYQVIVL